MTGAWSRRDFLKAGGFVGALALTPGLTSCGSAPEPTAQQPSRPAPGRDITDAQQAAEFVLSGARSAAAAGSFGISGAIIDNSTGRVIKGIPNRVLERLHPSVQVSDGETFTWDPTAHGERQLVHWYYANRNRLSLPAPHKLTVVTSLDPCVMCTGALATAGFNAGVVAMDTFSGVNYTQDGEFADLSAPLDQQVRSSFGYYAVEGGRGYQGGESVVFADTAISQEVFDGCGDIYQTSAKSVRSARSSTNTAPDQLRDPATWKQAAPIRAAFQQVYPDAFRHRLKDFRRPDAGLERILQRLVEASPGADNAVAFIDPFGNVITAAAGPTPANPAATAFLTTTQAYATTRFDLVDDKETTDPARRCLTSPKYGTFVWLHAPDPRASTTLADLGGFGSTMQSAIPQKKPSAFQFYRPPRRGTVSELRRVIAGLPPLYSKLVGIDPQQV